MMDKSYDYERLMGFALGQTDRLTDKQMDICDCIVAFMTEKCLWLCVF